MQWLARPLNPWALDPIEISENPSEILGRSPFLTKYGSVWWFFHNNLWEWLWIRCSAKIFPATKIFPPPVNVKT